MTQKTKQIIISVVIIIISFIGFKMFFAKDSSSDSALVPDKALAQQFVDGQAILALLDRLNKVILDDSIFSDKIFVGLVSFEKPIPDQVIGRKNPFLPIGVDGSGLIVPRGTSTLRTR